MNLYHGSNQVVEFPGIQMSNYTMDFSWGFYATVEIEEAKRQATKHGNPIVNVYRFTPTIDLKILKFDKMTDEWLDFVVSCRNGGLHNYDIVEGPMADDTIWNYLQDYLDGEISREAFWALVQGKSPDHQISFHRMRALCCLEYVESQHILDKKEVVDMEKEFLEADPELVDLTDEEILAWDPDFTKLTKKEAKALDEALIDIQQGNLISMEEINW